MTYQRNTIISVLIVDMEDVVTGAISNVNQSISQSVMTYQRHSIVGVLIVDMKHVVTSAVSDVADVDFLHPQFQLPSGTLSL